MNTGEGLKYAAALLEADMDTHSGYTDDTRRGVLYSAELLKNLAMDKYQRSQLELQAAGFTESC